jgi:phosphatidylglycerophosphatase GEP4
MPTPALRCRYLTDVVYGNRHGMLTIRVAPLETEGEPTGVWLARGVEERFVGRWAAAGEAAPQQQLCPGGDYQRFVLPAAAAAAAAGGAAGGEAQ